MASFTGWTEGILLSVLFVLALTSVIGGMNGLYGGNYDGSLGLDSTGIQEDFNTYQTTLQTTTEGQATFGSVDGLSLSTSWKLIKATGDIIWSFTTGGWTENVVSLMQLPSYFAIIFRMLWFISIGFIIITILFKVRP